MNTQSLQHRFARLARRFETDGRGNIAVIFAIVLVPLLSFVGAAVDYTRASTARTAMQTALDSAALMVSKENQAGTLTREQLTARAEQLFKALYNSPESNSVAVTASFSNTPGSGSSVVLTGSAQIDTQFMKVAGFPTMSFGTSSTTSWGMTRLRVALALDNTGSMADDGKMAALQTSAKSLIDQLSATAQTSGDVYISIVPFANVVNLGTNFKNSGYIDWSNWSPTASLADQSNYDCGSTTRAPTYNRYGYLTQRGSMRCGVPPNNVNSWNGCVTDRGTNTPPGTTTGPDVTVAAPTTAANYYPADQSNYCPQQIAPLSYDWPSLKTVVNNMSPSGGTNQPIGLVWAWQTLQQSAPFSAPAEDSGYTYKKAIILLSDGLNTMDRWPSYGNGQTQYNGSIDARQQLLCDNIKAAGVTVYTIQVNTSGDPTSTILQNCASGSGNFFATTTASGIAAAFQQIQASLTKLRISR